MVSSVWVRQKSLMKMVPFKLDFGLSVKSIVEDFSIKGHVFKCANIQKAEETPTQPAPALSAPTKKKKTRFLFLGVLSIVWTFLFWKRCLDFVKWTIFAYFLPFWVLLWGIRGFFHQNMKLCVHRPGYPSDLAVFFPVESVEIPNTHWLVKIHILNFANTIFFYRGSFQFWPNLHDALFCVEKQERLCFHSYLYNAFSHWLLRHENKIENQWNCVF